ncbi:uncharacterized protein BDZ99DRAFT_460901 [Mytilinidion resinicola]|uniref:Uncharacterized protein n=1 Tax=Mytilinidion resinicola TaxID=574789 RepID=A0A6A6YTI7_9PEZI|nr:uncharacterized protein BDZ99DRAFT_460901 [Mytilinidion resinicola]KAF2812120.1 hypothetical protein BDZ99DRAFT_460901 [Mytilinidion resinicola]
MRSDTAEKSRKLWTLAVTKVYSSAATKVSSSAVTTVFSLVVNKGFHMAVNKGFNMAVNKASNTGGVREWDTPRISLNTGSVNALLKPTQWAMKTDITPATSKAVISGARTVRNNQDFPRLKTNLRRRAGPATSRAGRIGDRMSLRFSGSENSSGGSSLDNFDQPTSAANLLTGMVTLTTDTLRRDTKNQMTTSRSQPLWDGCVWMDLNTVSVLCEAVELLWGLAMISRLPVVRRCL